MITNIGQPDVNFMGDGVEIAKIGSKYNVEREFQDLFKYQIKSSVALLVA